MEKYNLIQTSSIQIFLFKQAKMVSDLFPNQSATGKQKLKRSTSSSHRPAYRLVSVWHLLLLEILTFILKEFSAVVVWVFVSVRSPSLV